MIHSIKLSGYRGFPRFAMNGLGRLNLIVGKNNSGKTSILESLQLLASGSDPNALWRILSRRGEVVVPEPSPNRLLQAEIDVAHLFYGHEVQVGTELKISSANQHPNRSLHYVVSEAKQEESPVLFAQLAGEEPTTTRLAVKISGTPDFTLPPIPISNQGAVRNEVLQQLANIAPRVTRRPTSTAQYIPGESLQVGELLQLWNSIVLTPDEDRVTEALRLIDDKIERVAAVGIAPIYYPGYVQLPPHGGFAVRLKETSKTIISKNSKDETDKRVPIGSFGDGIWRILGLAVAVSRAQDNLLLVDEIDTGLHYSVMTDMWRLLFEAAERFNVQVFATTHSYDCVHSLASICRDVKDSESQITIHRVEIGKTESIRFSERQIRAAADREIEIR